MSSTQNRKGKKPIVTEVAKEKVRKAPSSKAKVSTAKTRLVENVDPVKKTTKSSAERAKKKSQKAEKVLGRLLPKTDSPDTEQGPTIEVRRIHRRDLNQVWEFLKRSFRDVNRETLEYQRPRSKKRFLEIYEEENVEQLLFSVGKEIVAYAECAFEQPGGETWINPRYFEKRDMRPLFVEELAVDPEWQGRGVGGFVLDQLHHSARVRGLTHLVLEVAENNENALQWYKRRGFRKLDAAIFMAQSVDMPNDLLPPRELPPPRGQSEHVDERTED